MKNIIKFLSFILYSTCIFFFPNNKLILIFIISNIILTFINIKNIRKIISSTFKFFPFIIFTFIINCLLDDFINALWVGVKLIIVCNATIIYSQSTTVTRYCRNYPITMYSPKNF